MAKKKAVKKATPRKRGRPSKYCESFVQECYDFFDRPLFEKLKNGSERPNMMPTIEGFACHLMLHKDTIYEWAKVHKDFSDALNFGRQRMKEFLNYHALHGNYNGNYAKFFAINSTDMVEKKEVELSTNEKGFNLSYKLED